MIEKYLETLINELGATGLLVVGLYWILCIPLKKIARHLHIINEELGDIADIMRAKKKEDNG